MREPRDSHLEQSWRTVFDLLHGRLSLDDIARQLGSMTARAMEARARSMRNQTDRHHASDHSAKLKSLIKSIAGSSGSPLSFDEYKAWIESELVGIVVTAHPTFAYSDAAWQTLKAGVAAEYADDAPAKAPDCSGVMLRRNSAPSLDDELAAANEAVHNARAALRPLLEAAVDVGAEQYPERYRELDPRICTIATWVGFDLDGRNDIAWNKSLSCRYELALAGVSELQKRYSELCSSHAALIGKLESAARLIKASLETLANGFALGAATLGSEPADSMRLGRLNRLALERRAEKLDAVGAIDSALSKLLEETADAALSRDLIVFRSEWRAFGTGLARLHFRLNSVQLHNAIRSEIPMLRSPGSSASRRHFLSEISRLIESVDPVNVHYGSVARERTTAKRIFMLAAQFKKHFDERVPMRLLIAESDTPFTLLVALYYARLFGVEDNVEISPLFETADGLHHGDRVIGEVLDNPSFLDYLRRMGRFCIQLGFSDSGRYIGQPAASLAIERFKLRLVRLWSERGLHDIPLVFFDTHGESMGRGAHPRSLRDRFLYTHSREVRKQLDELKAPYKHEVSFQGADGYLWFSSQSLATAVMSDLLATRLEPPPSSADVLYSQSGWALDFFLTLQDFQKRLTQHPGYVELVSSLGRNLLYPTGSRPLKRQSAGGPGQGIEGISDLRAIPNNAILQQLAYLANSCSGLGQASQLAPETFHSVVAESDRLERVLGLALEARSRSDITMLEAYVELMSADYWLDRSSASLDRAWSQTLRRVSSVVEESFDQHEMAHFLRTLRVDAALLDDALDEHHARGVWSSSDALTRLHVLRLALIQFIYIKATEIPSFSPRLEVSLTTLSERLARLEVNGTVELLREIFPISVEIDDAEIYAEKDTYAGKDRRGYAAEHESIFDPIQGAYGLILEITALIALHVGSFG